MSTNHFVPQLWSAKILDALDKELVYSKLFNADYEGEISDAGDTVHIAQVGAVSIKDYTKRGTIDGPEDVTAEDKTLTIDQAKYFNVSVDDVDAAQSAVNLLDTATQRAGYGFSDVADAYLGDLLATSGTVTDGLGTDDAPLAITKDNAYETLVKIKVALDNANLPKQGRVAVVPAEFEGYMLLDPRFVNVTNQSEQRLTEGEVYKAAGFEIHTSNNVPKAKTGEGVKVIASSPIQGTYAQQVLKTEAYRPESGFSDAVKGLHVYGAAVLRPEVVAVATVSF